MSHENKEKAPNEKGNIEASTEDKFLLLNRSEEKNCTSFSPSTNIKKKFERNGETSAFSQSDIQVKREDSENFLNLSLLKQKYLNSNHIISRKKRVIINVGGERFETYRSTLKLLKESRLSNLSITNSDYDSNRKEFFFDRDPASFKAILNFYRTGKLHAPSTVCGNLFYDELSFWGIDERYIEPCCWTEYSTKRECNQMLKKVMRAYDEYGKVKT
jgi:hypothetical protein